jgi:hypothetical protein
MKIRLLIALAFMMIVAVLGDTYRPFEKSTKVDVAPCVDVVGAEDLIECLINHEEGSK